MPIGRKSIALVDEEAAGSTTVPAIDPAPSLELGMGKESLPSNHHISVEMDPPRRSACGSCSTERDEQNPNANPNLSILSEVHELLKTSKGTIIFIILGAVSLLLLGIFSFDRLPWQGWFSLSVMLLLLAALVNELFETHVCMLTALLVLSVAGIVSPRSALAGFANEGVATVAILYIVAEGLSQTGILFPIFSVLLGKPRSLWEASTRLLLPVGVISGFLNNTPTVAFMIPVVLRWCRRSKFAPSKFLMSLNNTTALGGTLTLIGTSTNLVLAGLAKKSDLDVKFGVFSPTSIAAAVFAVGLLYLVVACRWIPDRGIQLEAATENARNYTMRVTVKPKSAIVGDTIDTAGLRHLKGLHLLEIIREGGEVITAPEPETIICVGDTICFAGDVDTLTDIYLTKGLVPATTQTEKFRVARHRRKLVQVVVAPSSSILVGHTARDTEFRTRFNAVVVAVNCGKECVLGNVADIAFHGGNALLLETDNSFLRSLHEDPNFALVAEVPGSQPPRRDWLHMAIAASAVAGMIAAASAGVTSLLVAAGCAGFVMVVTRCLSLETASAAVNIPVMLTVAASFGLSNALSESGAAAELAKVLAKVFQGAGSVGLLTGIYLSTALVGSFITNSAAVSLMFPIVAHPKTGLIETNGLNPYAALYCMMFAASAAFATPIGGQTNLMCHAAGGYKFMDWVAFGTPLQLLALLVTVFMAAYLHPT